MKILKIKLIQLKPIAILQKTALEILKQVISTQQK